MKRLEPWVSGEAAILQGGYSILGMHTNSGKLANFNARRCYSDYAKLNGEVPSENLGGEETRILGREERHHWLRRRRTQQLLQDLGFSGSVES